MKSYWSNQIYCSICSFTNRYFYMSRYVYKNQVRYYKSKKCLECVKERQKIYRLNHQRQNTFKEYRKKYLENLNNQQLNHIREINLINAKNYRIRMRQKRELEEKRKSMTGIQLK